MLCLLHHADCKSAKSWSGITNPDQRGGDDIEKLIDISKKQAEIFLLDAGEFYPFGTCIDKFEKIIPIGAYSEEEKPNSAELIDLLEKDFKKGVDNGDYQLAVIAVDIVIRKNSAEYDGIELRFFEMDKDIYKKYFKYSIKDGYVEFIDYKE